MIKITPRVAIIFYAILTCVLARSLLIEHPLAIDVISQAYPWMAYLQEDLRSFRIPLWNPYVFSGFPYDILFETDFLHLLALILLPTKFMLSYQFLFTIFLAGVALFFYAREKGFSPEVSLMGGAFYLLAPTFISYFLPGHVGKMFIYALVPLLFLCLEKGLKEGSRPYAILGGVVVGMFPESHPGVFTYIFYILNFYAIFLFIRRKFDAPRFLMNYFLLGVIGLLVAGPILYAYLKWLPYTARGGEMGLEFATSWS